MNNSKYALVGAGAVLVAIVVGVIFYLHNFDATKIACNEISNARSQLQSAYDAGVDASVQIFAEEKAQIDENLSRCLSAKPIDPCAEAQQARDTAVENFNNIQSPVDNAPYSEFQQYFAKRDQAYSNYKKAKEALEQCRSQNPPKAEVSYEHSDTKACFDVYDKATQDARNNFNDNTQAMRSALNSALSALDAREKACNPPTGKKKFTKITGGDGSQTDDGASTPPVEILNCKMLDPVIDAELLALRKRAGEISIEITSIQTTIDNANKRMSPLQQALRDIDTYIPPESTKTQLEGALNALRAQRKINIEASLDFYKNLISRKQVEKSALEQELSDVQAKIQARLDQIKKENEARQRNFPTALHLSGPDKCAYYHCHGMLCGRPDPESNGCGHGATRQDDVDCKKFFNSYLEEAGGK